MYFMYLFLLCPIFGWQLGLLFLKGWKSWQFMVLKVSKQRRWEIFLIFSEANEAFVTCSGETGNKSVRWCLILSLAVAGINSDQHTLSIQPCNRLWMYGRQVLIDVHLFHLITIECLWQIWKYRFKWLYHLS